MHFIKFAFLALVCAASANAHNCLCASVVPPPQTKELSVRHNDQQYTFRVTFADVSLESRSHPVIKLHNPQVLITVPNKSTRTAVLTLLRQQFYPAFGIARDTTLAYRVTGAWALGTTWTTFVSMVDHVVTALRDDTRDASYRDHSIHLTPFADLLAKKNRTLIEDEPIANLGVVQARDLRLSYDGPAVTLRTTFTVTGAGQGELELLNPDVLTALDKNTLWSIIGQMSYILYEANWNGKTDIFTIPRKSNILFKVGTFESSNSLKFLDALYKYNPAWTTKDTAEASHEADASLGLW